MKSSSSVILFLCIFSFISKSKNETISIDLQSMDKIFLDNEFVVINFYADWCPFSQMLSPVWSEVAEKVDENMKDKSVVVGKVDCVAEEDIAAKFEITKYPTIKYVRNGQIGKREYRGERSPEGILEFVHQKMNNPVKEFSDWSYIHNLDEEKKHIIGYLKSKQEKSYRNFIEAAADLQEECSFHISIGNQDETVIYDSKKTQESFQGDLSYFSAFYNWVEDKCTPLVREFTFENAEEITEEGKPFVLLFHLEHDKDSLKQFSEVIGKELMEERHSVNFLSADGFVFAYPLYHIGKTIEDLPLIVADSFEHMFPFPNFKHIHTPGKLKKFIQDLLSGKLHREFHQGPDPTDNVEAEEDDEEGDKEDDNTPEDPSSIKQHVIEEESISPSSEEKVEDKDDSEKMEVAEENLRNNSSPPPSVFKKLGPSPKRYTFKDEF